MGVREAICARPISFSNFFSYNSYIKLDIFKPAAKNFVSPSEGEAEQRAKRAVAGRSELVGILFKMSSDFFHQTPPFSQHTKHNSQLKNAKKIPKETIIKIV